MGMARWHLARFWASMADQTSALAAMLTEETFQWSDDRRKAFETVREVAASALENAHFHEDKEVTLFTDASDVAVSACLLQEGRMVFCASQLLNKTMRKYAVIEKEMYGLVFGVKQFRCFLQGKEVNAWTDHKPLLAIVRQLYTENARLARLKSALADFELKLSWVATDKNISDIWTRLMKDGRLVVP